MRVLHYRLGAFALSPTASGITPTGSAMPSSAAVVIGVLGRVLMSVGAAIAGRERVCTVGNLVDRVTAARVPAQVLKSVVERVTVVVAAFHSWRARANERQQHRTVSGDISAANPVAAVTAVANPARVHPFATSYVTEVRDLITGKIGDVFPLQHSSQFYLGATTHQLITA